MCLLSFLKWGSIGYSLGSVQWDFTRQDHPWNPGRVTGSGLVTVTVTPQKYPRIFIIIFIIYFVYKLSELGFFQRKTDKLLNCENDKCEINMCAYD